MGCPKIASRLAGIDIENPRIDAGGIEAGLRAHLERLQVPAARIKLVRDPEAAFREVARMADRGWERTGPAGPRWSHKSHSNYFVYALWEERGYFRGSRGFATDLIDREIMGAATRSVSHWRNPRRVPRGAVELARPVLASRVAARAIWDESDAANPRPRPPEPGEWRSDFTREEMNDHWKRRETWSNWVHSVHHQADRRAELAEPLVGAIKSGLFAFFWLRRPRRGWRPTYACVAVPRPLLRVARVPRGNTTTAELHSWDEPAVHWSRGPAYWYWHGIRVWQEIINEPSRLTARYIVKHANVERRRILLERLGYERFLESAGARLAQQDNYGKLWKTELRLDGEPVTVVEVANSTQESDGSYRRYFLRVPPGVRTARQAVAWTFAFERAGQYTVATQT